MLSRCPDYYDSSAVMLWNESVNASAWGLLTTLNIYCIYGSSLYALGFFKIFLFILQGLVQERHLVDIL